jgi:hypothetical protein
MTACDKESSYESYARAAFTCKEQVNLIKAI